MDHILEKNGSYIKKKYYRDIIEINNYDLLF